MTDEPGKTNLRRLWMPLLGIALVAAVPRFYWMLTGSYNSVVIIFVAFALLPIVLLDKVSRRSIGFVSMPWRWIPFAFVIGATAALIIYLVGYLMHGNTELNWFATIMKTFDKGDILDQGRQNLLLFAVFTLPVMIFSPLGEEFFFRGLLHESFAERFNMRWALAADAGFFGLTHLAHYGLYLDGGSVEILPSAVVWVFLMSASAVLFYQVKRYSGSIWGAVLCHSGFNFSMMAIIFYVIH